MSANELLSVALQLLFILLGFVTVVDYLRHRDKTRRDIALMFGALAATYLIPIVANIMGIQSRWFTIWGTIALVSQPYLLLRLVQYFRPVPPLLMLASGIWLLVSGIAFLLADLYLPVGALAALLAIIIAFAAIDGYAMLIFVQGALTTTGVVRQRLRLAAAGSGLLALALICLALTGIIPPQRELFTSLTGLVAIGSALCYYVGFAPPRWLQRAWQLTEIGGYLAQLSSKPMDERFSIAARMADLCRVANRAVGGIGAGIVRQDASTASWILPYVDDLAPIPLHEAGMLARVWENGEPYFLRRSDHLNAGDQCLLETVGADTLLIAPIVIKEGTWGVLLVFLQYSSLFIDDDLHFVSLLAKQNAIFLENDLLIDQLLHLNTELELRASQLTAVNRELEAFSYSVSHDLRAPLRALHGFSQLLVEDYAEQLDDEGKRYLQRIQTNSQRMGQMIDDLLVLSQITRSEMWQETVDLSDLAHQIAVELREQYPEYEVEFEVEKGLAETGDTRLLRVALSNLLGNAWKYTGKQAQPRVVFGKTEREGQCIYFIRDNGAGFDMAYANKLFGVFQRLHSMTEFPGNGIGLATVQRIVSRHGGQIWAEATLNEGATFYFTLWDKRGLMGEE